MLPGKYIHTFSKTRIVIITLLVIASFIYLFGTSSGIIEKSILPTFAFIFMGIGGIVLGIKDTRILSKFYKISSGIITLWYAFEIGKVGFFVNPINISVGQTLVNNLPSPLASSAFFAVVTSLFFITPITTKGKRKIGLLILLGACGVASAIVSIFLLQSALASPIITEGSVVQKRSFIGCIQLGCKKYYYFDLKNKQPPISVEVVRHLYDSIPVGTKLSVMYTPNIMEALQITIISLPTKYLPGL